jgi:TolB-like protein
VTPSESEVRAALEQVLGSSLFANGGRASSLLRYLVEQTLAGGGDRLKEYVVGVELFGRGDQFDPRVDTIVRVEARRLRARLDEYYAGPGAADLVRIEIPRGSYVPTFALAGAAVAAAGVVEPDVETAPPPEGSLPSFVAPAPLPAPTASGEAERAAARRPVVWLAGAALVAVVALAGWQLMPDRSGAAAQGSGIRIAVLPIAHFSTEAEVAMIAARITDGVTAELARVPELSVVSRTTAARYASEAQPIREAAEALDAVLIVEGSIVVEAGGVHAVMRIVDASLDRKVWVGEYDSAPGQIAALQKRIASEVATAVLARFSNRQ